MLWNISSPETIILSMETNWRTPLFTAVAPIAWGSTYYVSAHFLPTDRPLFAAAVRALPAGLLLLAVTRTLPRGAWVWKAGVLGLLNIGLFFPLIFVAAFHLPGGLASTLTATAPIAMMLIAWLLIRERPTGLGVAGAIVGVAGVGLLVLRAGVSVDLIGVAASLGAVLVSSVGYVLVKRWQPPVDMLTLSSWQLLAGSVVLVPLAALVEGAPPAIDGRTLGGFVYVGLIGTALAYVAWMSGLKRMPAGAVALIGLINPVTGTLIGVALAHESFGLSQAVGMMLVLVGVLGGQPAARDWLATRRQNAAGAEPADRELVPAA